MGEESRQIRELGDLKLTQVAARKWAEIPGGRFTEASCDQGRALTRATGPWKIPGVALSLFGAYWVLRAVMGCAEGEACYITEG